MSRVVTLTDSGDLQFQGHTPLRLDIKTRESPVASRPISLGQMHARCRRRWSPQKHGVVMDRRHR